MTVILYLLIGALAGFAAGLFGVGGGLVVVPALVTLFAINQVDPAVAMHLAVGTSLATIVVTSLSSISAHHKRGNIDWRVFRRYSVGLGLGAVLGALIADRLPGDALRMAFGVFSLLMAAQLAFGRQPKPTRTVPGFWGLSAAGTGIGAIASLVGIGGGGMTVPYLIFHNVETKKAVGISAAGGFPIAVLGAIAFFSVGRDATGLPDGAFGYFYLPAFLAIVALSVPCARLGAQVASRLPDALLKKCFALFLLVVGSSLLVT